MKVELTKTWYLGRAGRNAAGTVGLGVSFMAKGRDDPTTGRIGCPGPKVSAPRSRAIFSSTRRSRAQRDGRGFSGIRSVQKAMRVPAYEAGGVGCAPRFASSLARRPARHPCSRPSDENRAGGASGLARLGTTPARRTPCRSAASAVPELTPWKGARVGSQLGVRTSAGCAAPAPCGDGPDIKGRLCVRCNGLLNETARRRGSSRLLHTQTGVPISPATLSAWVRSSPSACAARPVRWHPPPCGPATRRRRLRSTETIMVTLQTWQEQMSEDMRLRDFRPRTQEGYLAATRQFMDWTKLPPRRLTDEHVRAYFLYLRDERKLAPSTINIAIYAVRFFFHYSMQRDCRVFRPPPGQQAARAAGRDEPGGGTLRARRRPSPRAAHGAGDHLRPRSAPQRGPGARDRAHRLRPTHRLGAQREGRQGSGRPPAAPAPGAPAPLLEDGAAGLLDQVPLRA